MNNDLVYEILANLIISDNLVKINRTLERDEYLVINDILTRIGGSWNKSKKAHIFTYNPEEIITNIIEYRILPEKPEENPLAFFPTPQKGVDFMIDEISSHCVPLYDLNMLEPSGGLGIAAKALVERFNSVVFKDGFRLDVVELDKTRSQIIEGLALLNTTVYNQDFLSFQPNIKYNIIIMNPPFSVAGDGTVYITHIRHAWSLLKDEGLLVSIIPQSWKYNNSKKVDSFKNFVFDNGKYYDLPKNFFKESGTLVGTSIISLQKSNYPELANQKYLGYKNYWLYEILLTSNSDLKFYEYRNKVIKSENFDPKNLNPEIKEWLNNYYKQIIKNLRDSENHVFFRDEDMEYLYSEFLGEDFA